MIEAVSGWVKNIVLVALFASFMELLLPNSRIQAFVRTILGLFIMLTILNPVIDMLNNRMAGQELPAMRPVAHSQSREMLSNVQVSEEQRHKLAQEIFCRDLGKQIAATVKSVEGVKDAAVIVTLDSKGSRLPIVTHISISLFVKDNNGPIKKVQVKQTEPEEVAVDARIERKIKSLVSEFYQVKYDQISVKAT